MKFTLFMVAGENRYTKYTSKLLRAHWLLRNMTWNEVTVRVTYRDDITNDGTYTTLEDAQGALSDFSEQSLRDYVEMAAVVEEAEEA